jgi:hypothetical protein
MEGNNPIVENLANPHELEKIYRKDPEAFKKSFLSAWEQNQDSPVLAVWHERLFFQEESSGNASFCSRDFLFMGLLAILAGLSTRIILYFTEQSAIAPINFVFGIAPFLAAYFIHKKLPEKKIRYIIGAVFLVSALYINLLPLEQKDSINLAYLHLPVFLWVLVGLAYTGNEYGLGSARLSYLKFNGEFAIIYTSMGICGIILSLLTISLFQYIGLSIEDFYLANVVEFGAAALAIVAAYLILRNLKLAKNIAPYLAKIFSPLVLATLVAYLIAVVWVGKNPFLDRNFLLSFNIILFIVLGVTIYSISESGADERKTISDYINCALIMLSLVIDTVALSAILFRLTSYGITPNRIAVLGVNILIWANLIWITLSYLRFLRNKNGVSIVQDSVTKFLPVYGLWAAFVTFAFPLIF